MFAEMMRNHHVVFRSDSRHICLCREINILNSLIITIHGFRSLVVQLQKFMFMFNQLLTVFNSTIMESTCSKLIIRVPLSQVFFSERFKLKIPSQRVVCTIMKFSTNWTDPAFFSFIFSVQFLKLLFSYIFQAVLTKIVTTSGYQDRRFKNI